MKYMENRKGQGFDTFKLLIAAVVAMVILGIVTGVFQKIWAMIAGIQCVSSPINELITKITEAQSGIVTVTEAICLKKGQEFDQSAIADPIGSVNSVTFDCGSGGEQAAVCDNSNEGRQIDIAESNTLIRARADTSFRARISCDDAGSTVGNYLCTIEIINA